MPDTVVLKYGGNAMADEYLQHQVIEQIKTLKTKGYNVILAHGGGPFIKRFLEMASIQSEFIDGHRITDEDAIEIVESALKGYVNGRLISLCQEKNITAVGLSGKDAGMVLCHPKKIKNQSLGWVGEVQQVDPSLLNLLLERGILPVVTCIATDKDGNTYNVNGDLFAAHLAGAVKAAYFLVLTNTDGLYADFEKPETLISSASHYELEGKYKASITGGMMPKIEACLTALDCGVPNVRIVNGTEPENLSRVILEEKEIGTKFLK